MKLLPMVVCPVALIPGLCGCVLTRSETAASPPAAAVSGPVVANLAIGGPLGASLGSQFDQQDREIAYAAEIDAVATGERQPWRGPHGTYGFVDAGPNVYRTEGSCRQYTQTIYLAGRAHAGSGLACHQSDGEWHIID